MTTSKETIAVGVEAPDVPKLEDNPAVNTTNDYQDNRRHAWMTVAGVFFLQFYVVGTLTAFGVFQDFYTTSYLSKYSPSAISWIGGVEYFFELGLAPVGGKLYDAGHGRLSILVGSLISTICFFMLSLAKPNMYHQIFLAQGFGMGVPLMMVFGPSMTMVSQHFKTRRALAMGIVAASSPLGSILYTTLLNYLFHGSVGFAWAIRFMAFMSLGLFVIGNALIRPPSRPPPAPTNAPPAPLWDLPYLLTLTSAFLWSLGANTPNFYMQLFARQHGVSETLVFNSFSFLSLASIAGRILSGWMSDRWGAINVFIPSVTAVAILTMAFLGCGNAPGLIIFSLLFGYFFGTLISVYLPMVASMAPPGTHMGRRMGLALTPVGIGSTIGPPIAGAILGRDFVWLRAIVYSSALVFAAAVCNICARQIHRSRSKKCGTDYESS